MTFTRRQIRVLFVIGVIMGVMAVPVIGAFLDAASPTSGTVSMESNSGPRLHLADHGGEVNLTEPFPDDNTIEVESAAGNITLSSGSRTNVTVTNVNGTWTNTTDLNVTKAELELNPDDKPAANVTGDAETFNFSGSMAIDDGNVDFVYSGSSGTTNVTVRGLSANTQVGAVDQSGTLLAVATTDGSGTLTLTGMSNSEHAVELQTSDGAPVIDESTATPQGNQSTVPSELSVNVSDPDFDSGDSVDVTFYLNGSELATKTVSSDGEVTASIGTIGAGTHTWNVTAEDEYGNTDESQDFEFSTPGNLSIFRETQPTTLIDDRQVNLTITHDGDVFTRNTSNGEVDLSGLPTEDLVIRAEANGYFTRQIVIESLSNQPRLYMLNTSVATVNTTFLLEDKTGGNFPPETTQLFVKKPVTRNGNTTYETVVADEFGTNGVKAVLEEDERYRLIVKNVDDDERVLGPYTTGTTDETVTLTVGSLTFDTTDDETYSWDAYFEEDPSERIKFEFSDPDDDTTDLQVVIYERGNTSNEIYNETSAGPVGNVTVTQLLDSDQANKTWVVDWDATRGSDTISGKRIVGRTVGPGVPMDQFWKNIFGVMLLVVLAGTTGAGMRSPEAAGLVLALVAGILWAIEWLPAEVGAGSIIAGIVIAGLMMWSRSRGTPA